MTKVINKKVLPILLALVFSICWFVVPASAEEINDDTGFFAEGATITRIGDIDEPQGRSITSCLLRNITVTAYGGIGTDGKPIGYSINGEYGYAQGPSSILNCSLPSTFYQGMIDLDYDYFLCVLVFSVEGTNLQRVVVKADDEVKIDTSLRSSGWYTVTWTCPRKQHTIYDLIVYSNNVNSMQWGHIDVA